MDFGQFIRQLGRSLRAWLAAFFARFKNSFK
jgi:hypothetical protein